MSSGAQKVLGKAHQTISLYKWLSAFLLTSTSGEKWFQKMRHAARENKGGEVDYSMVLLRKTPKGHSHLEASIVIEFHVQTHN